MYRLLVLALVLVGCNDSAKTRTGDPSTGGDLDDRDTGEDVIEDTGEDSAVDTDTGEDTDTEVDTDTDTDTGPIDRDGDGFSEDRDCDDGDPSVYPGAPEICDGKDNDCNGIIDDDADDDGDGIYNCSDYCPVYAAPGATGDGRVDFPMGTIQEAVDVAGETSCNEVRAYQGTYYENVNWNGWPVNAESVEGAAYTIIDGGGEDSVVVFINGEDELARIYDFTITNGGGGEGAGVRVRESSPVIEGNIITNNATTAASHLGGGIRIYNGSPVVMYNEISFNDAGFGLSEDGSDGGAICIRGGSPWIEGNLLSDNIAGDGGGIWVAYSNATIVDNLIVGNWADDVAYDEEGEPIEKDGQGGGINIQIGAPTQLLIAGNIIANNAAAVIGGGIVTYEASTSNPYTTIINNTIVYNEVVDADLGAGFTQFRRTTPTVYNNIIAFNEGIGAYSENDIDSTFTYNLVYGNTTAYGGTGFTGSGTGNLTSDPRFRSVSGDWTTDDYRLQSSSPAVNAGNPSASDADGSRSDIGAYGGLSPSSW